MDLPTYTNIWRIEKRLYKLYDFRLPMPLPVGTFGVALGVFALWVILLSILNAPFVFGNGWHLVMWVVPPGVITVLATRPVVEGKRLTELLISQARFLTEARVYTRLAPEYEPAEIRVSVRVWHRDPEAGPLPVIGRRRVERAVAEPERAAAEDTVARPEAAPPLVGLPVRSAEVPAERVERVGAVGDDGGVESAGVPAPLKRAEPVTSPARPEPIEEPEPGPVRAVAPERAVEPEPERLPEPDRGPDRGPERGPERARERERVPVAAAALSGRRGDDFSASRSDEPSHTLPDEPRESGVRRRGVGRRVLNYFGFGLGSAPPEPPGETTGQGGDGGFEDFEEEAVHATEDDEQSDNQDWFARLRSSSGETPVGLTSKSAFSVGDTGAMSREDLADAIAERDEDRRRAEEVMAAPESADDESPAARRLRGRVQGIRVTRDLEERRSEQVRESAPTAPRAQAQGQGQALPAREESDAPEPPRRRGRPHAAPWDLDRSGTEPRAATGQTGLSDYAARFAAATGRPTVPEPAAAPWLPPSAATPDPEPGTAESEAAESEAARGAAEAPTDDAAAEQAGSGTAADDAAATAGTRGPDESARAHDETENGEHSDTAVRSRESAVGVRSEALAHEAVPTGAGEPDEGVQGRSEAPEAGTPTGTGERDRADQGARTDGAVAPAGTAGTGEPHEDTRSPEEAGSGERTDSAGAARSAKPALEIDHGTGEQAALPPQPNEGAEAPGPAWVERMSVLDQHLSTADTPAPPRPKFADVVPAQERGAEAGDPGEWFDDGKKRHPDQPKVGDRDNPVIPASELREAAEAEAGAGTESEAEVEKAPEPKPGESTEPVEEAKPPTQLDHGTGELVSFVEVRDEPSRAAPRRKDGPDAASRPPEEASRVAAEDAGARAAGRFTGSWTVEETTRAAPRRAAGTDAGTPAEQSGAGRPSGTDTGAPDSATSDAAEEASRVSARRTAEDLAAAEAAALARRRAAVADAPVVRDPRANASMASALGSERSNAQAPGTGRAPSPTSPPSTDRATERRTDAPATDVAQEPGEPGEPGEHGPHGPHGPHDGVFHRVAQNARRLGQLFGQPAPGEEPAPHAPSAPEAPKPELELDHGTGEQDRLGDTPNGVPTHRPEPQAAEREEPASDSGGTRGWRRLAKVVTGGAAPVRSDLPASDIERLRTPLDSPCGLVVLGCTGGAGQTVTTLMIGHTLAAHRDDRIVAVDVNPGPNGLSRRVGAQSPETLTALLANADSVEDYAHMRSYASRAGTGLEVVQTLDDPYVQTLDERDYTQLTRLLGGFYSVTLLDPAATGVARSLPGADGLVLVAPASADAERAVSMTFDWLDGNGYGALRANSVLVVNGVSKRSLDDVDAAERVARGRCRAIVRIPWDDHLGSSYTRIDVGALRPATKRAHGALGGVLVNVLTGAR